MQIYITISDFTHLASFFSIADSTQQQNSLEIYCDAVKFQIVYMCTYQLLLPIDAIMTRVRYNIIEGEIKMY